MPKRKAPVRVTGLVRLCHRVRAEAGRGLDPQGREALALEIRQGLLATEELCGRAGSHPSRLAAPSRNAYRYLRSIDLGAMPAGREALRAPIRANGVLAATDRLLSDLAGVEVDASAVTQRSRRLLAQLERTCERRGGSVIDLPAPSRRAATVLGRLTIDGAVDDFRRATIEVDTRLREGFGRRWPQDRRTTEARIAALAPIWRWRSDGLQVKFRFTDAVVCAPAEILSQMVAWALGRDLGKGRRLVERWLAEGARDRVTSPGRSRGLAHDLKALFDELNQLHFAGQLSTPILEWGGQPTFHKFGQYTGSDDRVTLSSSLDDPRVPRRLVAYVLFHELLHKHLSAEGCRGHDARFRRRERGYPDFEALVVELNQLADRLRRRR